MLPLVLVRILVVDDDEMLARTIARSLRDHECVVSSAPESVIARVEDGDWYDLVLCDLHMPGRKGTNLLADLRTWYGDDAPLLVLMTGSDAQIPAITDLVLRKPFVVSELRALVDRVVEHKTRRRHATTTRIPRFAM